MYWIIQVQYMYSSLRVQFHALINIWSDGSALFCMSLARRAYDFWVILGVEKPSCFIQAVNKRENILNYKVGCE